MNKQAVIRPDIANARKGEQLGIGATQPLDGIFLVEDGEVEIYAAPSSTRRFVAEFRAGAVLFGAADAAGLTVFAPNGARLSQLSVDAIPAADRDGLSAGEIAAAIDAWVTAISAGLARGEARPADVNPQRVGEKAQLAAGSVVTAAHGVVWIEVEGGLRLLGSGEVSGHLLPLATSIWATVESDAVIATHSSASVLNGDWRAVVQAYAKSMVSAAQALDERDRAKKGHHFERRQRAAADSLTSTNSQFVDVLSVGVRPEIAAEDDLDYALNMLVGTATQPGISAAARSKLPLEMQLDLRGQRGRSVLLSGEWWRSDRGALLGYLTDGHKPVALIPDWSGRYILKERGRRPRRLDGATATLLERRAYSVVSTLPNRPLTIRDLTRLAFSVCRPEFVMVALVSVIIALIGLVIPIATGRVVDIFIPDGLRSGLVLIGIVLVIANGALALLRASADVVHLRMDGKLGVAVLAGILDRVLRMPAGVLKAQSSADLGLRVLSMDRMRRSLSGVGTTLIVSASSALSSLGLLAWYAPIPAAAAAAILAVFLIVSALAGFAQNNAIATGEAMTANLTSLTLQIVQNMPVVRAFGAEQRAYVQWGRNAAAQRARSLRSRLAGIRYTTFVAAYDGFALAAIFLLLGYTTEADKTSLGTYIAFVIAFQNLLAAGESAGSGLVQLITTQPLLKRANLILETPPETAPFARAPGPLAGSVELSGVSYRHDPKAPLAVDNVSLRVEPGQFVALVGPTGSGKTTILNLILGFDVPQSGTVLINGVDLAKLDKIAVRRQIGVVMQSGRLMPGSIFENLTGLHDADLNAVWEAAELAGVADDIRALPMGMHTLINEGAPTLSGGQVQRLLLARALVAKPRLLILDEATSALDSRTQATVMANIEKLGVSRIVIAHRLGTVRNADMIHFVLDGKIVQSGGYDELLQADGPFAAFARRQSPSAARSRAEPGE